MFKFLVIVLVHAVPVVIGGVVSTDYYSAKRIAYQDFGRIWDLERVRSAH